jgi:hypothetical protein
MMAFTRRRPTIGFRQATVDFAGHSADAAEFLQVAPVENADGHVGVVCDIEAALWLIRGEATYTPHPKLPSASSRFRGLKQGAQPVQDAADNIHWR